MIWMLNRISPSEVRLAMICVKCDEERGDLFYGRDRTCKECRKAMVRINRANKIDYYREFDRQRANHPHRVEARKKYYENVMKSEEGKKRRKVYDTQYKIKHTERRAAHIAVGNALRRGDLQRHPCIKCGHDVAEAHHEDYSRPLDVVWLCRTHHLERHKEMRNEAQP